MKTKHLFVPALDVGEALPFAAKVKGKLAEDLDDQERCKEELVKFIDTLEKNFKEPIWYMGMDVIGEKSYERFIFDKGGFFEIMTENPIAMNAHFVHASRSRSFLSALKKTLKQIMSDSGVADLFISSLEVQTEKDSQLTVSKWHELNDLSKP
ncbi:hypothetical protein HQ545_07685 [Candidatus Woesearchaeota archaeon]|nr:hypothetical protein [Candidatus Woesearchaeota archaeon]